MREVVVGLREIIGIVFEGVIFKLFFFWWVEFEVLFIEGN